MSRIWVTVIISAIVVSLCIYEASVVNSVFNESNQFIEKMSNEYKDNDFDGAKDTAKKFNSYWKKHEHILCLFYSDNELDSISVEISILPLLSGGKPDFLQFCNTVRARIGLLKEHSHRILA